MKRYLHRSAGQAWSCTEPRLLALATFSLVATALIGCGSSSSSTNFDGGFPYVASLTQAQESPPTGSTATGTASFTVSPDKTQILYSVMHNVVGGNAAHLHTATVTNSNPVPSISLSYGANSFTGTAALTQQNVADLEAGRLYINIHNSAHPDGDIRGQVIRPTEALYIANMRPTNEVPPVINSSATGAIGFILSADGSQITYSGSFTGLSSNSTLAHFHCCAMAGANGPPLYSLTPPNGSVPVGVTSGTFAGQYAVNAMDVTNMNSGNWYANVHTTINPSGEIRDQVRKQ